jgi:phosphonoacetate hydrolase
MIDGLGTDYFEAAEMPNLRAAMRRGWSTTVEACIPTVTNVNNVGGATGAWPEIHGITANSYVNLATREEHYMDRGEMVLTPTVMKQVSAAGLISAVLTSKRKTISLLGDGAAVTLAAEAPAPDWVDRLGPAPDIYSGEINYWLLDAARLVLGTRPDVDLVYCHTTDFPMHMSGPDDELSQQHLHEIDDRLGRLLNDDPDLVLGVTGDHAMGTKRRCYDLNRYLAEHGCPVYFAMSTERDPYTRHHRNLGGTAYVWLHAPHDAERVIERLILTEGVEGVYRRHEAAALFHLHRQRIGDLVVLGDRDTVFGPLERAVEDLPANFRTHGSRHESRVPLIVSGAQPGASARAACTHNLHLTHVLSVAGGTAPTVLSV